MLERIGDNLVPGIGRMDLKRFCALALNQKQSRSTVECAVDIRDCQVAIQPNQIDLSNRLRNCEIHALNQAVDRAGREPKLFI